MPDLSPGDRLLQAALTDRDLVARPAVWDDSGVDWSVPSVVVVRSPWDYDGRRDEFLAWAGRVADVSALWNPADVLRWNTHKSYLLELEERGAPVVPTAWLARGDRVDLAALARSRAWGQVVVKPCVSAGSRGTERFAAGDPAAQAHLDDLLGRGDAMVQPYLSSVTESGELSLLYADHAFTHAVRKRPGAGEFRVQESWGGTYEPAEDRDEAVKLGSWILEATGHRLLYARVDLLRADDGAWQLAELEVTEPDLYLHVRPDAADRYAEAIAGEVAASRRP